MAANTPERPPFCIWMEAGVIAYKICNRNFDCANCEFDRAMTETARRNLALQRASAGTGGKRGTVIPWQERKRRRLPAEPSGQQPPPGQAPPGRGHYLCPHCTYEHLLDDRNELFLSPEPPRTTEVFGFVVPTSSYLHRGHTWVQVETGGRVRVGLDDFSQKVLGPPDVVRLPELGQAWRHDGVGLEIARRAHRAAVLAPVDGVVAAVNPKVRQNPALVHDDPYGEGWLVVVSPTNLKADLETLLYGRHNVAWIEHEAHKLLGMLETAAGVTLPSGGAIIDDVFGHFPELGWQRLVAEFLHTS